MGLLVTFQLIKPSGSSNGWYCSFCCIVILHMHLNHFHIQWNLTIMELLGTGFFFVVVRFHLIQVLDHMEKIFFYRYFLYRVLNVVSKADTVLAALYTLFIISSSAVRFSACKCLAQKLGFQSVFSLCKLYQIVQNYFELGNISEVLWCFYEHHYMISVCTPQVVSGKCLLPLCSSPFSSLLCWWFTRNLLFPLQQLLLHLHYQC